MDRVGLVLFDGKLFAAAVAVEWYCANPTSHRHKIYPANGQMVVKSKEADHVESILWRKWHFFRLFKKVENKMRTTQCHDVRYIEI